MYMSSPTIEEKLKKSDCTLEELLDEDEIIQEMKNQNSKLLTYFEKSAVKNLINYIITEPETDDHKKGHKYPFIASEILNCDVNKINELFTLTDVEINKKERKTSEISNNDSDMVLSSDDHFNAFSNDDKKINDKEKETLEQEEEGEKSKDRTANIIEENVAKNQETVEAESPSKIDDSPMIRMNKSINDLINNEHPEENIVPIGENTEKNKNRIELLDHLLSFVETDKELNYVLTGYFSKFLNLLLNKFPHKIIGYIYLERPEILDRLLQHSKRKSIADLLPKLILVESYLGGDKSDKTNLMDRSSSNAFSNLNSPLQLNIETISVIRRNLLVKLFQKLLLKELDPELTSNLTGVIIEIFENRVILEMILKERAIVEHIIDLLSQNTPEANFSASETSDMNYNYCEILNIFIHILRYSQLENLKCPTYKSESEDLVNSENEQVIDNTLLGECILNNLEQILSNFLPEVEDINSTTEQGLKTIEGTFGLPFKPLGLKRVKLVEMVCYLLFYFKNVHSIIDKILIKSQFLKYLVQYFFQYEWNNTYQLHFDSLIKHYFTHISNHPEITKYLFEDLRILDLFIRYGNENKVSHYDEKGFCFNSNRKINHGYFAILIDLSYKLSQIDLGNSGLKEAYFTEEWQTFVKEKVNYWKKKFESKLCVPETSTSSHMNDGEFNTNIEETQTKENSAKSEDVVEEFTSRQEENNPFPKKETGFFGTENEDWFNPKPTEDNADNIFEDINNNFEFVEDNKNFPRKSSKDEMLFREMDNHLTVDEVDEGHYSDTEYWKGVATNVLSVDKMNDLLKELEL